MKVRYWSKTRLSKRGWTQATIDKYLGAPDATHPIHQVVGKLAVNRDVGVTGTYRGWIKQRVVQAEQNPECLSELLLRKLLR